MGSAASVHARLLTVLLTPPCDTLVIFSNVGMTPWCLCRGSALAALELLCREEQRLGHRGPVARTQGSPPHLVAASVSLSPQGALSPWDGGGAGRLAGLLWQSVLKAKIKEPM